MNCRNCKRKIEKFYSLSYCNKCKNATDEERHEEKMKTITRLLGVKRANYNLIKWKN